MSFFRFLAIMLLFSAAFIHTLQAQTAATVTGTITDASSGNSLEGATVFLVESRQGAVADSTGRFTIENIRPGEYTMLIRLLGYQQIQTGITLLSGQLHEQAYSLERTTIALDEVLSQADRPYSAASSTTIRAFDMITRPVRSSQDLLQLTPGLITAQHAGGGKAEQIFLRGFDADHGTDVAISVDGMPVNMVSHGHGQGYADLHFLMPEVVEAIEVSKGPYDARFGNLATAGAIAFKTKDHLESNMLRLEGGSFSTGKLSALYQIPFSNSGHQGAYFGGQFYTSDGPVESPQGFNRFNLFGKFHTHLSENSELALSISGFSSAWDASGQIPNRAIQQGLIGRFGSIDDLEGGTTGRQDVNLTYTASKGNEAFRIQGYASRYNFKLFSNFTFFLEDPVNGDMIEQIDDRRLVGINSNYRFTRENGGVLMTTTLGGGFRADDANVALWKSPDRQRAEQLVMATVAERNLSLWVQEEFVFTPWLQLQLGLRGDYFTFNVDDLLEGTPTGLPQASGYAQQGILSPKINLVVSPTSSLDIFANAGSGFHSNDARAIVQGRRVADLLRVYSRQGLTEEEIQRNLEQLQFERSQAETGTLPRAIGTELGLRQRFGSNLVFSVAAWMLDLDEEFVYVGDGGYTELSGRSRRYGVDLEARGQLARWLSADADVNLSRGILRDEPTGANRIPLAPQVTSTGGLTIMHPNGLEGSLRYIHVGDRPANEVNSVVAQGYTLVNLGASYPVGRLRISLVLENLFDVAWNEAQFDTASRLPGETSPVSELHFTPGNPRSIRLGMGLKF